MFSWLYNRAGQSLPVVIAAHFGAHLINPSLAMPDATPIVAQGGAFVILAMILVMSDRRAFRPAPA
ncbi:MAG: hypothetical protein AB7S26_11615 [Sandaracinaceae bacterium]